MPEAPIISAKAMSEFAMRETHLDSYKRSLLLHLELVNGIEYATEVRNLMVQMHKKGKGK